MGVDRHYKARTRTAGVSTVVGIGLVLFMLGVLGFLVLNAQALERYFKENVRVELFLKRDLKEVDVMRFRKELDTEPYSHETRYVTADEAAEQLKQELGEDFLGVLGSNPLLPSVELRLNADHAQTDSLKWIVAQLERDPRVQEVAYNDWRSTASASRSAPCTWWVPPNGSSRNPSSDRVCGKGS